MVYEWKAASHIKGDPQVAGEVCSKLRDEGRLTAQELVNESRDENAPLHGMFTWDNTVAAEKWRCHEAGHIIRCLVTVQDAPTEHKEPTRVFVSIKSGSESPKYDRIDYVLRDASKVELMLRDAKSDLLAFKRKYEHLSELAEVFKSIDRFVDNALELTS